MHWAQVSINLIKSPVGQDFIAIFWFTKLRTMFKKRITSTQIQCDYLDFRLFCLFGRTSLAKQKSYLWSAGFGEYPRAFLNHFMYVRTRVLHWFIFDLLHYIACLRPRPSVNGKLWHGYIIKCSQTCLETRLTILCITWAVNIWAAKRPRDWAPPAWSRSKSHLIAFLNELKERRWIPSMRA